MEGLRQWWAGRTQREQRLLLVMFALLGIVLAWLLTLPCAAILSGMIYWLLSPRT